MSKETSGISWLTLESIAHAVEQGPGMDGRLVVHNDQLNKDQIIRPRTIGGIQRDGTFELGPAWQSKRGEIGRSETTKSVYFTDGGISTLGTRSHTLIASTCTDELFVRIIRTNNSYE